MQYYIFWHWQYFKLLDHTSQDGEDYYHVKLTTYNGHDFSFWQPLACHLILKTFLIEEEEFSFALKSERLSSEQTTLMHAWWLYLGNDLRKELSIQAQNKNALQDIYWVSEEGAMLSLEQSHKPELLLQSQDLSLMEKILLSAVSKLKINYQENNNYLQQVTKIKALFT